MGEAVFLGLAIANILSLAGSKVIKEYYINDIGHQIEKLGASIILARGKDLTPYKTDIKPEECYGGTFLKTVAASVTIKTNDSLLTIGHKASQIILKEIQKTITQKFKIHYDKWTRESDLIKNGYLKKDAGFGSKKVTLPMKKTI